MNKSAYIITTPLQYINATNIPDQSPKECFLIKGFKNSETFYNEIKKANVFWERIHYFQNKSEALGYIINNKKSYQKLFLDSDFGIRITFSFFQLRSLIIYTYEEGYGSYRPIRKKDNFKDIIGRFVYSQLGCKNWIGGNRFTKGIYLYYPNVFRSLIEKNKKELFSFNLPFSVHLNRLPELSFFSEQIKPELFSGKRVLVYLTSWTINPKISAVLNEYPDYLKILKPHPHLKSKDVEGYKFDIVYDNSIPAEILIPKILHVAKKIVIVHENSSALIYLNSDQITAINISNSTIGNHQYNTIMKQFKQHNETFQLTSSIGS